MVRRRVAASEHLDELDGLPVFWRHADAPGGASVVPALYLHGVPTSSDDWEPFLAAHGGLAPDLPGFGRSGKPAHFSYGIEGYADWLEAFLSHAGVEGELDLVVHDWGAVGLAFAQRHPERIRRLVILNAVPFLEGYRWHWIARVWRRRVVGELAMGAMSSWALGRLSRAARPDGEPLPAAMLERVWSQFDYGTQRAILRLYRGAPEEHLARAGERLCDLGGPALVAWGARDPYIDPVFAERYGARLPQATVELLPDAGHWPWLDRPDLVERVGAFLRAP